MIYYFRTETKRNASSFPLFILAPRSSNNKLRIRQTSRKYSAMTISASPSSQGRFRPCERAGNAHDTHIHALRFSIITAPSYQTQETQQSLFCPLLPRFKTSLGALFNQQIAKSEAINNKTKTKHYEKALKHILIQHILVKLSFNPDTF